SMAWKEDGHSNRYIVRQLVRSPRVVNNFVNDKENYARKKSTGRPKIFSERDKLTILKCASNSFYTASKIATSCGIAGHLRTVQRVLKDCPHLNHKKARTK